MTDSPFPVALSTDSDDVRWALSVGHASWTRGDKADAVKWVKRASESAADAGDDDRALALARAAAELKQAAGLVQTVPPPQSEAAKPSPQVAAPPAARTSGVAPTKLVTKPAAGKHSAAAARHEPRPLRPAQSAAGVKTPEPAPDAAPVSPLQVSSVHDRATIVGPIARARMDTPTEIIARGPEFSTSIINEPRLGALEVWCVPTPTGVTLTLRKGPRPEGAIDAIVVVNDISGLEALLVASAK